MSNSVRAVTSSNETKTDMRGFLFCAATIVPCYFRSNSGSFYCVIKRYYIFSFADHWHRAVRGSDFPYALILVAALILQAPRYPALGQEIGQVGESFTDRQNIVQGAVTVWEQLTRQSIDSVW